MAVTRRQMKAARERHADRRIVMQCGCPDVRVSADPDDYFYREMDEKFENCAECDRPYKLGYVKSEWVPV